MLARKGNGKEAKLSYSGHVLMENRNGMVADVEVLQANGTAERDAALLMMEAMPGDHQVTVGADKGYEGLCVRGPESECDTARCAEHPGAAQQRH
jgi:hypothetical protein